MFPVYLGCQDVARLALGQCDQCASMVLADHGVALPVAYAVLLIHDLRTFVNADTVLDRAPAFLPARVTLPVRLLATQVPPQGTTSALVCVDVQVDRLMNDLQHTFQSKSPGR